MNQAIGHKVWAIAEGYIPAYSNGPKPQFTSHETACILNTSDQDAHVKIWVYFSDRDPVGPYQVTVPAKRTKHLRFNDGCASGGATYPFRFAAIRKRLA